MSRSYTTTDPAAIPGVRPLADYPTRPAVARPAPRAFPRRDASQAPEPTPIGHNGDWGYIPDYSRADDIGDFWDGAARVDRTAPTVTSLFNSSALGLYDYRTWYREPGKVDLIQAAFRAIYPTMGKNGRPITLEFLVWFDREEDGGKWCVYCSDGMWHWATTALSALLGNINDAQRATIIGDYPQGAR